MDRPVLLTDPRCVLFLLFHCIFFFFFCFFFFFFFLFCVTSSDSNTHTHCSERHLSCPLSLQSETEGEWSVNLSLQNPAGSTRCVSIMQQTLVCVFASVFSKVLVTVRKQAMCRYFTVFYINQQNAALFWCLKHFQLHQSMFCFHWFVGLLVCLLNSTNLHNRFPWSVWFWSRSRDRSRIFFFQLASQIIHIFC